MRPMFLPVALLLASVSFVQAQECPVAAEECLVAYEFHVSEAGGFGQKTLKEMGSREFQAIVTVACAAYGVDCSSAAGQIRQGAEIASKIVGQAGSNVYITGEVTHHDGEEWAGIFRTPVDWDICDARLDYGQMSITGESTFNTSILRSKDNGLGFYAVIPKNRPSGQWVEAYFVVKYIKPGTQNNCAQTGTYPWLCKGQNCSPLTRF